MLGALRTFVRNSFAACHVDSDDRETESLAIENTRLRDRLTQLESRVEELTELAAARTDHPRAASRAWDTSEPGTPPILQPDGGEPYKIIGEFDEAGGIGVMGRNTATAGQTYGVKGVSDSSDDNAAGVSGHASATDVDAATVGVEGLADADANTGTSPEVIPAGVAGTATGDGVTNGVRGETTSQNGRGLLGFATSSDYEHNSFTASGIGVTGVTDRSGADSGISDAGGVFGWSRAESGAAYGVLGRNNSTDGWGVLAMDTSDEGLALRAVGDTELGGDTELEGDTELGGELAHADGSPQRTAGPIAKGYVAGDGTIENAVNLDSAEWRSDEERYRLSLTDEHYWFDDYATVVTPVVDCTVRVTSNQGPPRGSAYYGRRSRVSPE